MKYHITFDGAPYIEVNGVDLKVTGQSRIKVHVYFNKDGWSQPVTIVFNRPISRIIDSAEQEVYSK